jgi:GntR family transcriptional regulator
MDQQEQESHVSLEAGRSTTRQLADLIRADIEASVFSPGSKLPSEPQLAERYGLSGTTARSTAHNALAILRAEGLVRAVHGSGTFARNLPVLPTERTERQSRREEGQARGAFHAELERLGLTPATTTEVNETPAPADVAEELGVAPGQIVLTRTRQMAANDFPVQVATSYYPLDIARSTRIADQDPGPGGSYSRLAEAGHEPVDFTESVQVRPPTQDEVRRLAMDEEQRVFVIRRIAKDHAGRVVEVNDMVLPAHQWKLLYRWHT